MQMREHLIKLKASNGRYSSRRCSFDWMNKNVPGLFEWIQEQTSGFPSEYTLAQKAAVLEKGSNDVPRCPACHSVLRPGRKYCGPKCRMRIHAKDMWTPEMKEHASATRKQTYQSLHGVDFSSQRPEWRGMVQSAWKDRMTMRLGTDASSKLYSDEWLSIEYNAGRSASDIALELGCFYGTVIERLKSIGFEIRQTYQAYRPVLLVR